LVQQISYGVLGRQLHITFGSATQWFLVLRKISIAQTPITNPHQKPLSDHFNPYQLRERRCAACYAPLAREFIR
jgi:hypothetical protein